MGFAKLDHEVGSSCQHPRQILSKLMYRSAESVIVLVVLHLVPEHNDLVQAFDKLRFLVSGQVGMLPTELAFHQSSFGLASNMVRQLAK